MSYIITDCCIDCGACVEECPVCCIYGVDNALKIDDSVCIGCEACVAVCSVNAIHSVE